MQILRGVILIIILLLGRPTDMSEGLNKRCCNFLPDSLRSGSLSNVNHTYHRFDRRLYSILPLGILLYPSPNFTGGGGGGVKRANLVTFSTTLDLEPFRNGLRYLKSSFNVLRRTMIAHVQAKFREVRSTPH